MSLIVDQNGAKAEVKMFRSDADRNDISAKLLRNYIRRGRDDEYLLTEGWTIGDLQDYLDEWQYYATQEDLDFEERHGQQPADYREYEFKEL
ncbi:MAG: hypothetical protein K6G62_03190 [Eubacterium sp.]|nr:hypothetical protein [Eubacterium sp.]